MYTAIKSDVSEYSKRRVWEIFQEILRTILLTIFDKGIYNA
jgi:hypothetical protein